MNTLYATLYIDSAELEQINRWLEGSNKREECLDEDTTIIHTVKFENGKQMDIKCCGVQFHEDDAGNNSAWTEAVLFDESGYELTCSEVEEEYDGEWEIEYDGITYHVDVLRKN